MVCLLRGFSKSGPYFVLTVVIPNMYHYLLFDKSMKQVLITFPFYRLSILVHAIIVKK